MSSAIIPKSYDEWRHCIIVECGLTLTPDYISTRIASLQDGKEYYTQQFIKLYGEEYLKQVIAWFMQAQKIA